MALSADYRVWLDRSIGSIYSQDMCRNITILRGLEPEASPEEIESAARQYVRKVSGVQTTSSTTEEAFQKAVRDITVATTILLRELPPRQRPPSSEPPMRRRSKEENLRPT
jgi:hypothetical protein